VQLGLDVEAIIGSAYPGFGFGGRNFSAPVRVLTNRNAAKQKAAANYLAATTWV
jgi:hypothetical protein